MTDTETDHAEDYADAQRRGWQKLVRERNQTRDRSRTDGPQLSRRQSTLLLAIVVGVFVFSSVWTAAWPIPRGRENRDNAAAFLTTEFPDRRVVTESGESATAPVAALFDIIRRGEPAVAARAIAFAAEQDFGNASPYVIERLESDDPRLRNAARDFLRQMFGTDLGPSSRAWRYWWRDPPRAVLGVATVRHKTVQFAIPATALVIGGILLAISRRRRQDFVAALGTALLVEGWFLLISTLGLSLVGGLETCRFGGAQIAYYSDHGLVLGLEDARLGGFGLWLLLVAAYVLVPLVIGVVSACFFLPATARIPERTADTK